MAHCHVQCTSSEANVTAKQKRRRWFNSWSCSSWIRSHISIEAPLSTFVRLHSRADFVMGLLSRPIERATPFQRCTSCSDCEWRQRPFEVPSTFALSGWFRSPLFFDSLLLSASVTYSYECLARSIDANRAWAIYYGWIVTIYCYFATEYDIPVIAS